MHFQPLPLAGAFLIDLDRRVDDRGSFARMWCRQEFASAGLESQWVQTSLSQNHRAGTLRGLHYQAAPFAEAKLVTCLRGAAFDVIVDLRGSSSTCGQWAAVELTESNRRQIYIPRGFAHGFQTLTDNTELLYQISSAYEPTAARGIRWDDPTLSIDWPAATVRTLSERDRKLPGFQPCSEY